VEDTGGPVVPKVDCPHLARHVKFGIVNGKMQLIVGDDDDESDGSASSSRQLAHEFQRLCLEGNLMTSKCQHGSVLRKRVSRKRLRSEDGNSAGKLKCEEDYEMNQVDANNKEGGEVSCPKENENWLCLECGALLCSRYANGHAKMHYEDTKEEETEAIRMARTKSLLEEGGNNNDNVNGGTTGEGHCVAVSLADLSVWCYECNAYLRHSSLEVLTKYLEELKFGNDEHDGVNEAEKNSDDEKELGDDDNSSHGTNDGKDTKDEMEEDVDTVGDLETTTMSNRAISTINDSNCCDKNKPSINKRKGHPRKLPPEQLGTTILGGRSSDANSNNNNDDDENEESESSSNSESSSSDEGGEDSHQAAIIASLLQSERSDALRAFFSRYESFDTSNMGQCVPMHMPKPPSFPDEMADFLKSPLCKSVVVLAGAGMSVSSGIPDFRSAGIGLYDTIRPELLTASELEQALIEDDPTLALDKGMFLQNPFPLLETKRSFILGTYEKRWRATLAHRFVELLHTKLGKLTRLYTQNIDGLEGQTKLPREKVVNVHGSMGAAACEHCGEVADFDYFCEQVRSGIKDVSGLDVDAPRQSTPIHCLACGKPTVKPTIVLFRGSMPKEFHTRTAQDLPDADLLIVMGTSLTVAPANSLVYRVPPTALRMVMNNEKVGRRLGIDYSENSIRDVWAHGYTDETCLNLAEKMGWLDDLALIVDELPDSSAQLLRERLVQRQEEEEEEEEE